MDSLFKASLRMIILQNLLFYYNRHVTGALLITTLIHILLNTQPNLIHNPLNVSWEKLSWKTTFFLNQKDWQQNFFYLDIRIVFCICYEFILFYVRHSIALRIKIFFRWLDFRILIFQKPYSLIRFRKKWKKWQNFIWDNFKSRLLQAILILIHRKKIRLLHLQQDIFKSKLEKEKTKKNHCKVAYDDFISILKARTNKRIKTIYRAKIFH